MARYSLVAIRLYLGAWMLLNGLNHFLPIFPQPMGGPFRSSQLMVSLIETGLFDLVKTTEIVVGICLLLDVFVPVALVMALPISIVIWYNHAILGGKPFDFSMGIGCLVWNLVLLVAYLNYYLPMMRLATRIGRFADLRRLRQIVTPEIPSDAAPETQHRLAIGVAGLVLTAGLAYHLHPDTVQPAGSGKTPAAIVREYITVAYNQGQRSKADDRYLTPELAKKESTLGPKEGNGLAPQILQVIAQGSNVAVYSRQSMAPGVAEVDVVDLYRVAGSRITEHARVTGPAATL